MRSVLHRLACFVSRPLLKAMVWGWGFMKRSLVTAVSWRIRVFVCREGFGRNSTNHFCLMAEGAGNLLMLALGALGARFVCLFLKRILLWVGGKMGWSVGLLGMFVTSFSHQKVVCILKFCQCGSNAAVFMVLFVFEYAYAPMEITTACCYRYVLLIHSLLSSFVRSMVAEKLSRPTSPNSEQRNRSSLVRQGGEVIRNSLATLSSMLSTPTNHQRAALLTQSHHKMNCSVWREFHMAMSRKQDGQRCGISISSYICGNLR